MELMALMIKINKDERGILERFFEKVKDTLAKAHGYSDNEADFETYRYILQNTNKPAKDYIKIFQCLSEQSRKKILKYMGHKTEASFKKSFTKNINVYNQSIYRRDQKEDA